MTTSFRFLPFAAILLAIGAAAGYGIGARRPAFVPETPAASGASPAQGASAAASGDRRVLYWYDPMVPQQKFDKPGKSPFMDMQLVPKYAGEAPTGAVSVDPRLGQTLGWRTAIVEKKTVGMAVETTATVQLNDRDVALVQARTAGFVQRVNRLAPGDVVRAGTLIVELLVPEWAGAQQEFLAVRAAGDASLTAAARQRLVWLGMPSSTIGEVERTAKVQATMAINAPIGGLVQELMVRPGMTVTLGMTLARINGLSRVWLEAALPEAQAGAVKAGQLVEIELSAFPGESLKGQIAGILPEGSTQTRTLRVRVELPNPQGRLRAGMFGRARFAGEKSEALVVPAEAVIRTGQRAVVYVVDAPGQFRAVEVQLGRDLGDKLEVRDGLRGGEQVVASGQFLIDSEASMQGVLQRQAPASPQAPVASAPAEPVAPVLHHGTGKVLEFSSREVTLDHGPVPTMQWGAMQMPFKLSNPDLAKGMKPGDRVRFAFVQTKDGFEIREIDREPTGNAGAAR